MTIASSLLCRLAIAALVTASLATAALAEEWTKATIKTFDADEGKITLKHEPLKMLEMPAMTMVFGIDAAMLKGLSEGDVIEIEAANVNGQFVVKQLRKP